MKKTLILAALLLAGCNQSKQFTNIEQERPTGRPVNLPPNSIVEDQSIFIELPCKDGIIFSVTNEETDTIDLVCGDL